MEGSASNSSVFLVAVKAHALHEVSTQPCQARFAERHIDALPVGSRTGTTSNDCHVKRRGTVPVAIARRFVLFPQRPGRFGGGKGADRRCPVAGCLRRAHIVCFTREGAFAVRRNGRCTREWIGITEGRGAPSGRDPGGQRHGGVSAGAEHPATRGAGVLLLRAEGPSGTVADGAGCAGASSRGVGGREGI